VAHFQLHFSNLKKVEGQLKVMEWNIYGEQHEASHYCYRPILLLPTQLSTPSLKLMVTGYAKVHCCHCLVLDGRGWLNTCHAFVKGGVMRTHGLCGKEWNRKRKFVEEEEADLKAFMDNLKQFAEPSAARFVREATRQIEMHDTDDDA
jgi:hypothetical protein